jgi:stress-induced morphogen
MINLDTNSCYTFVGDSDGLLTKGLVSLLCRGLSGSTWQEIERVHPAFIQIAGISASLTPGRNNGFLNMLSTMKRQAKEVAFREDAVPSAAAGDSQRKSTSEESTSTPSLHSRMVEVLCNEFNPVQLRLLDVSHSDKTETHFQLWITSDKFEGLNIIKRQKLIYQALGTEIMAQLVALQIMQADPPMQAEKDNAVSAGASESHSIQA